MLQIRSIGETCFVVLKKKKGGKILFFFIASISINLSKKMCSLSNHPHLLSNTHINI